MKSPHVFENFSKRQNRTRLRRSLALIFTILFVLPAPLSAQTKKPQHKSAPAAVKPLRADCGGGVQLRVSAASPAQGTLLIAEVRSPDTLSGVAGKWIDRDISFWQATGATVPKGVSVWRALRGGDPEHGGGY